MSALYQVKSKNGGMYTTLGFNNNGYYITVEDINTKHQVSTSYGFGAEALKTAKEWFEVSSGWKFKEVRNMNKQ